MFTVTSLGLALASSLGVWVFFGIEAQYLLSGKSQLRLSVLRSQWQEGGQILRVGFPGAASYSYQTLRGLILNHLLEVFIGRPPFFVIFSAIISVIFCVIFCAAAFL